MLGHRLQKANQIARKLWKKYHPGVPLFKTKYQQYNGISYWTCLGQYRKVRAFCSKPCCGNPRKWFGEETRQEKIHSLKEEMESY